jgi:hypothetical protein
MPSLRVLPPCTNLSTPPPNLLLISHCTAAPSPAWIGTMSSRRTCVGVARPPGATSAARKRRQWQARGPPDGWVPVDLHSMTWTRHWRRQRCCCCCCCCCCLGDVDHRAHRQVARDMVQHCTHHTMPPFQATKHHSQTQTTIRILSAAQQ